MALCKVEPEEISISLLLEADPSEEVIRSYLSGSLCFAFMDHHRMNAACVVKLMSEQQAEICNISVLPDDQGKGLGTALLKFSLEQLRREGVRRVELGTGTFGYQLAFYQRIGFRVDSVVKDHFLKNYDEPVYENGIQHRDMLKLSIDL